MNNCESKWVLTRQKGPNALILAGSDTTSRCSALCLGETISYAYAHGRCDAISPDGAANSRVDPCMAAAPAPARCHRRTRWKLNHIHTIPYRRTRAGVEQDLLRRGSHPRCHDLVLTARMHSSACSASLIQPLAQRNRCLKPENSRPCPQRARLHQGAERHRPTLQRLATS